MKYSAEFFFEFRSIDRFLYRVSDLNELDQAASTETLERLDHCHIYMLGKRPRLSILPDSLVLEPEALRLQVQYSVQGVRHQNELRIPKQALHDAEAAIEVSPYPHRELLSRDTTGKLIGRTLLANFVHLMPSLEDQAKDLQIVYVGKGLRNSAQDRLKNHSTLQQILADINSNEPEAEVFALVYAFKYLKNALSFSNFPVEVSGEPAKQRARKALLYLPNLDEQVALIEASAISYFRPTRYNSQYLDFPNRNHTILNRAYDADLAAIVVQIDNTNIGGQRIYSENVAPASTHFICIDFRYLEGKDSFFDAYRAQLSRPPSQTTVTPAT